MKDAAPQTSNSSLLVPLGIILLLLGILVPLPLTKAAFGMAPGTVRTLAFLATDILRLCFFAGIVVLIVGLIRKRKRKGQTITENS